jgi:hypothetical protein
MLLYQFLSLDESLWLQTIVRVQRHGWLNPEFRFSLGMLHMYVRTRFLTDPDRSSAASRSHINDRR